MARGIKVKRGMKGSSAGRGRSEHTAELKSISKKARRCEARMEANPEINR